MIEFNAQFIDGPHAGRVARLQTPKFEIGMRVKVCDAIYKVCNGPVAKSIELTGRGSDNCVVCLRFDDPPLPDVPLSEVGRIDRHGHSE